MTVTKKKTMLEKICFESKGYFVNVVLITLKRVFIFNLSFEIMRLLCKQLIRVFGGLYFSLIS